MSSVWIDNKHFLPQRVSAKWLGLYLEKRLVARDFEQERLFFFTDRIALTFVEKHGFCFSRDQEISG